MHILWDYTRTRYVVAHFGITSQIGELNIELKIQTCGLSEWPRNNNIEGRVSERKDIHY